MNRGLSSIGQRSSIFLVVFLMLAGPAFSAEILKMEIDGVIDPVTSEFIRNGLDSAREAGSEMVLIRLNTPGGLGISMQEIIQDILNSPVPVVCYVAPQGSHAASAGFFILLSADVAAMAPGTNTGAAHPVFPLGMEDKVMLEKVTNDALANLRAIVKQRSRNYELAEKGVLESVSYTAEEALEGNLIDLIANDESELLDSLQGREIRRLGGESKQLQVAGLPIRVFDKTTRQRFLSAIASPNLALILGLVGLLGLYIEFTHPGLILPGVVGAICLLIALLGFSLLPVNYVGVLLILLALGLFIAEVTVQGFGVLGIGGTVSLVLGLIFLIDSPYPALRIRLDMAFIIALPFAAIFCFFLWVVVRNFRSPVTTGREGLIGAEGVARSSIGPQGGKVFLLGEWWNAVSEEPISAGQKIEVVGVRNLVLNVKPSQPESRPTFSQSNETRGS